MAIIAFSEMYGTNVDEAEIYYKYFEDFIYACPFEFKFLKLEDLITREVISWNECSKIDPYMDKIKDNPSIIAYDIMENGFYFPITVTDNHDGTYTVYDGNHRIQELKKLGNKWNDRKIPAMILPKDFLKLNTVYKFNYELWIPKPTILTAIPSINYKSITTESYKENKYILTFNDINNPIDAYICYIVWPLWLNKIFMGKNIKPSKKINGEV